MLSVDFSSLSKQGALILAGGGRPVGGVSLWMSVLDEMALSCVKSRSADGGRPGGSSTVGEQMGDM